MFIALLTFHNLLRWPVIILGAIVIVRALSGWLGKKSWNTADDRAGLLYTILFDLQILIGLILYFFASPLTTAALRNFGGAMSDSLMRFYAVEHIALMLLALGAAHLGRSLSRKATSAALRFKRAAIWYGLSILLLLTAIPWPFFSSYGRPLLRLFGLSF